MAGHDLAQLAATALVTPDRVVERLDGAAWNPEHIFHAQLLQVGHGQVGHVHCAWWREQGFATCVVEKIILG